MYYCSVIALNIILSKKLYEMFIEFVYKTENDRRYIYFWPPVMETLQIRIN
jgi:hypothetical protein